VVYEGHIPPPTAVDPVPVAVLSLDPVVPVVAMYQSFSTERREEVVPTAAAQVDPIETGVELV